jgi:DNA-binding response OmpR family regulator
MSKPYKILYVEDDETLSMLTKESLESRSFDVTHCTNGEAAFDEFSNGYYDLCILDIMLPVMDGFTLANKIRAFNGDIPILFLTAKSLHEDKVRGFKTGADDYITKPFSMEELLLKIDVFLRRNKVTHETNSVRKTLIGRFDFDYYNQLLLLDGKRIQLTHREAELVKYFADNRGELIKREILLQKIWGNDEYSAGRSLDVFISRLRKIFSIDTGIKIENVHGVGFRLNFISQ